MSRNRSILIYNQYIIRRLDHVANVEEHPVPRRKRVSRNTRKSLLPRTVPRQTTFRQHPAPSRKAPHPLQHTRRILLIRQLRNNRRHHMQRIDARHRITPVVPNRPTPGNPLSGPLLLRLPKRLVRPILIAIPLALTQPLTIRHTLLPCAELLMMPIIPAYPEPPAAVHTYGPPPCTH
jgi:hypothetical protein